MSPAYDLAAIEVNNAEAAIVQNATVKLQFLQ